MNSRLLPSLALAACGAILIGCSNGDGVESHMGNAMSDDNYMAYEGQRFNTSKQYADWDDFKNDPNNFPAAETERMGEAVRDVEFLTTADDRETVMGQMFAKQFPGFGCGQLGVSKEQLDTVAAFFVEIPRTRMNRVLGYVRLDGRFVLVSDFAAPQTPMLATAVLADDRLEFYGMDKSLMRSDALPVAE